MANNGMLINVDFGQQDFSGKTLNDKYIECNFSRANLSGATLSGKFIECDLSTPSFCQADRKDGTFSECKIPACK